MSVHTASSPGRSTPLITILSAWVQLSGNTTHSGPGAPKNDAASFRQAYTISAAFKLGPAPLRPGLALRVISACATARRTGSGFAPVVAAWSR